MVRMVSQKRVDYDVYCVIRVITVLFHSIHTDMALQALLCLLRNIFSKFS